jgi:hypothetical protein
MHKRLGWTLFNASDHPHRLDWRTKWRWSQAFSDQSSIRQSTWSGKTLSFFHRKSVCSCLKDLYYNLKDNTSKRTFCHGCEKTSKVKNIFECNCKRAIYCSRQCAKRDWADHKSHCTKYVRNDWKEAQFCRGCKRIVKNMNSLECKADVQHLDWMSWLRNLVMEVYCKMITLSATAVSCITCK